jgi:hypothetical protein
MCYYNQTGRKLTERELEMTTFDRVKSNSWLRFALTAMILIVTMKLFYQLHLDAMNFNLRNPNGLTYAQVWLEYLSGAMTGLILCLYGFVLKRLWW